MEYLKKSKLFYVLVVLSLTFAVIGLFYNVIFIMQPLGILFSVVLFPVTVAGFLYYIFSPLVMFLNKYLKKKGLSILIVYLFMGLIFATITVFVGALLGQIQVFITQMPEHLNSLSSRLRFILTELNIDDIQILESLEYINLTILGFVSLLGKNIIDLVLFATQSVVSIVLSAITIPIVLLYMFKDGHKLKDRIVSLSPTAFKTRVGIVLKDINSTLASFIGGQVIVCMYVGTSAFLIFRFLGVPYAIFLGSLAGVMDIIPYVGPWIGVAPAFILAWIISPQTALILAILIVIMQLIESYVVYPTVMGKNLHIHPVTIIFLLMFAGSMAGIVGMIVAMPLYAVIKSVIHNVLRFRAEKLSNTDLTQEE